MNDPYFSCIALPDTERSLAATSFDGTLKNIGTTLTVNPIVIVFDNQSDVSVPLYINGVLYKTFSAGSVFVLDMRANHGEAKAWSFLEGTQFATNAAVGTAGGIYISILYGG